MVSANSYSGGTTMTGGTLQVTDNASIGTGAGVFDGGTFQSVSDNLSFANPFFVNTAGGTVDTSGYTLTLSGPIANGDGPGGLTATGFGVLVLTGTGTYTGGTTIAAGTLNLGNGGTSGSIVGDVVDDGLLAFNRSDTLVLPGVISGSGYVGQYGTGTTVLTGDNTYTAARRSRPAPCSSAMAAPAAALSAMCVDNGRLAFNRTDALSFGGTISGTGTRGPDRPRHHRPDRRQHLHRRYDDLGRHAAARRWRHDRQHLRRRRSITAARLQPLRQR